MSKCCVETCSLSGNLGTPRVWMKFLVETPWGEAKVSGVFEERRPTRLVGGRWLRSRNGPKKGRVPQKARQRYGTRSLHGKLHGKLLNDDGKLEAWAKVLQILKCFSTSQTALCPVFRLPNIQQAAGLLGALAYGQWRGEPSPRFSETAWFLWAKRAVKRNSNNLSVWYFFHGLMDCPDVEPTQPLKWTAVDA